MGEVDKLIAERDNLKEEIERLQEEINLSAKEKHQSAQLGLHLLEEKSKLQTRYDELESLHESTRSELETLRDAFTSFQTRQKASVDRGIEQEESLLEESASKDAKFATVLLELERELKSVRAELARVEGEKERFLSEHNELTKQLEIVEWERKNMKMEIKDLKARESRLSSDINELEEENIYLQKTVSNLKSNQIEYETVKHDVARLQDEVDLRRLQVEEFETLKNIAEKHMKEALEALESEREQKYELKKKLDERCSGEPKFNVTNIGLKFPGIFDDQLTTTDASVGKVDEDDDGSIPLLHQLESDMIKARNEGLDNDSYSYDESQPSSLFGEVHLTEIKKLEKDLESAENEKNQITQKLNETHGLLESTKSELLAHQSRLSKLTNHISGIITSEGADLNMISSFEGEFPEFKQFIGQLCDKIRRSKETPEGRDELDEIKRQLRECETLRDELSSDLDFLNNLAENATSQSSGTLDDLNRISEQLAILYYHICSVSGEEPVRIILDHAKEFEVPSILRTENAMNDERSYKILDTLKSGIMTSCECRKTMETIDDQMKHLDCAVESIIDIKSATTRIKNKSEAKSESTSNQQNDQQNSLTSDLTGSGSPSIRGDAQEELIKLKALLATKREQIATLRTVLKTNKQSAEVALANLKSKYEKEKAVVTVTMSKLRKELKALKEDAATFASLRSMFSARCEEYVAQIDELQRQLRSSDDEKKTLNSLLRMAIVQKLTVTQKLEEMEMDRERNNYPSLSNSGNKIGPSKDGAYRMNSSRGHDRTRTLFVRHLGDRRTPSSPNHHNYTNNRSRMDRDNN
ncbi:protein bicaudal D-like isoform X1 [Panonychus citri]|uniref:protein bicaudal D-like isoform X1 n=1 Tax=Panonychus citri TaxID=50023 RepID=UPI0023082EE7|nr:protein bicaudal D-like isoform X1 [Panonychus citri]